MTPASVREYSAAIRQRYLAASKQGKGKVLDEFCAASGYHRKAAVRLLRRPPSQSKARPGRPKEYALPVAQALRRVWEASDRLCSKRLVPFLPELLPILERYGELQLEEESRSLLLRLSAATVDRLLAPYRQKGARRPYTQSPSLAVLKAQIPIRTFGEWEGVAPGALQADLVSHCGESTEGFYLSTLSAVDVATGWYECLAVWGKGQQRVGTAVHKVKLSLPFPLRELHTDNGGEFLNGVLYPWCQREGIKLTRGRPYKKNDQAYVEQSNWSMVRRRVGYDRYQSKPAYQQLERVCHLLSQWHNFFEPISKLVSKERVGAKVKKRYDQAQTPYQRLLTTGVLTPEKEKELKQQHEGLNPVQLRRDLEGALEDLWRLRERVQAKPVVVASKADEEVCG